MHERRGAISRPVTESKPRNRRYLWIRIWIEQLRTRELAVVEIRTACHQHSSVRQQRGGMKDSRDVQRPCTAPGLIYRDILFATRCLVKIELAASHQHFTRRQ